MPDLKEEGKIRFFGEVDLNSEGGRVSDLPAWCFNIHIDEMEETIARKERQIELGIVAQDSIHMMKEEIRTEREKLESIKSGKPVLSGKQQDKCYNAYNALKERISDTLPSRKDMENGLVSAHDELNRMKNKHISISPEIAKACMVRPVNGKISGDEANKVYKILGKALGEDHNVERLRKDGGGEAYKTMEHLTQAILQGRGIK